ncbi:MAG: hypothetical protein CL908_18475 [Deltaproteobacteria bacterium]|nr:hypothetical protein [Deltaproteobacteria bacterium]
MSDSPSILILNERDPAHPKAGGAEVHVEQIFSRLAARGARVVQYSAGFTGSAATESIDGIEIERRGPLPAYYARAPGRVRRAGLRGEFDVVVECLNKVPYYSPLYSRLPVLALCHHLFGEVAFEQVAWPIATAVYLAELGIPRAYRDCYFMAISESTRDDLVARGLPAKQIAVSHPGIDPAKRIADPTGSRPNRITYLGRLEAYKNVDVMLRAAAALTPRFTDLEVVVIGRGPERERLERLADTLGLSDRTRFTGFIDDAERDALLAETRACVFPSPKEGWGLTVIEANALATPVVALDAPGLRDSVRHEETGLLVSSPDPSAFAEALTRLLEENAATKRMRSRALAWSKQFRWDRAADDMQQAIERSISGVPA